MVRRQLRWTTSSGGNDNQKFSYSPTKQGIVAASSKACLTAAAADGGGAEVTVYGGVAFLSNMDDDEDVTVTFEGEWQQHSVVQPALRKPHGTSLHQATPTTCRTTPSR